MRKPSIDDLERNGMVYRGRSAIEDTVPRKGFCRNCQRNTTTRLIPLSTGHIANACSVCGTCRVGRPYVSKSVFEKWNAPIAARPEGDHVKANRK